nr:hypothetical protein [Tanacetum cinerariifolium]
GEEKKDAEDSGNKDNEDNVVDKNIVYGCVDDLNMPNLEEIVYSDDDEDVDAEADMNNLDTNTPQVWTLVDLPNGKRAIRTKWIYINKKDERGIMVRNKARLDAHGYTQEEGIDYDEIDVKSTFLYGKIEEEFYVCQPLGFKDPKFLDRAYKVEKALYSLHQASRAWYETLSTYLLDNGFQRGQIDKTLFIKRVKGLQVTQKDDGIFISQDKYVDEILKKFGFSTVKTVSTPMETLKPLMKDENTEDDVHLYRLIISSLMYLTSSRPDIMFDVCACARFQVTPKVSHLHVVKRIFRYLKGQLKLGLWYPKDSAFNLEAYTNSDYDGASLDKKSTTRGCQFLGSRLILWQCKKQTVVPNSTTEADYVAASNCCGHVLCIQNQMLDYRYNFMNTKIFIDNESTIYIVKNLVFHSKTKHIEIRHHFIRDSYEKRLIQIHVKVDGKKVIISEATIRRDLKFEDKGGVDCLSNEVIFAQLPLMGTSSCSRPKTIEDAAAQTRVLNLETTKTTQAKEILSLKRRVKRLEKKKKLRTHGLKRLYKVSLSTRVESSAEEQSLDEEDASKQGRNIPNIDVNTKTTLVDETAKDQGRYNDQEMFNTGVLDDEEVVVEKAVVVKEVDAAQDQVSVATTTAAKDLTVDDITLAKALEALKTSKPKI